MEWRKRTRAQCRTRQGRDFCYNSVRRIQPNLAIKDQPKDHLDLPPQQTMCRFCMKSGHIKCHCCRANGLCLACGFGDHMISDCMFRRTRNTIPVSSTLLAPHIRDPVRPMCTLTATQPYQSTHLQSIQPVPFQAIQPLPPQPVCNYCQKPGHTRQNCRMAHGLCLGRGSTDHSSGECPHRRNENNTPTLTIFPTPPSEETQGQ